MKIFISVFSFIILAHNSFCFAALRTEPCTGSCKVVLITGASSGIGLATAQLLAEQGHRVYASMRKPENLLEQEHREGMELVALDVTSDDSVAAAFAYITLRENNRLDVLINNAGCGLFGPMELIDIDQAKQLFDINFFGVMRTMQAALPLMRAQNSGFIVNISSTSGVRPSPGWDLYAASKFALEGLTEAVAGDISRWNIKAVLVEPNATATDIMMKSTQLGYRITPETHVYENFMQRAFSWMKGRIAAGTDPRKVAEIIAETIALPQPPLRIQTTDSGRKTVADLHRDPSGKFTLQQQIALREELWAPLPHAAT